MLPSTKSLVFPALVGLFLPSTIKGNTELECDLNIDIRSPHLPYTVPSRRCTSKPTSLRFWWLGGPGCNSKLPNGQAETNSSLYSCHDHNGGLVGGSNVYMVVTDADGGPFNLKTWVNVTSDLELFAPTRRRGPGLSSQELPDHIRLRLYNSSETTNNNLQHSSRKNTTTCCLPRLTNMSLEEKMNEWS